MEEEINCFDGMILSGGGIRGIGHLGVLHYYQEKGELNMDKIKVYASTSIGSIISLLMICGYKPTEIFTKAYTLSNIIPIPGLIEIYEGIKNYGIMSIDPLMNIVKEMILIKLGKIPSLQELFEITGKVLVVSVSNVSKIKGEWFSHRNRPNLSCLDATKMSCNLPVIFKRIRYNGDYIIDGGFTDNFPSECPELRTCNKILGVAILSKSFFAADDASIQGVFSYPYNILLMCIMHTLNSRLKHIASTNDKITLIRLNFGGASILEFDTSSEKKMSMFMKGYEEAKIEDSKEYLMIDNWGKQHVTDGWDESW